MLHTMQYSVWYTPAGECAQRVAIVNGALLQQMPEFSQWREDAAVKVEAYQMLSCTPNLRGKKRVKV